MHLCSELDSKAEVVSTSKQRHESLLLSTIFLSVEQCLACDHHFELLSQKNKSPWSRWPQTMVKRCQNSRRSLIENSPAVENGSYYIVGQKNAF